MGQRFRLKLSRVLPIFQSCHSKDTSNPIPPLLKRHVSVSVRRNFRSQSSTRYVPEDHHTESSSEYSWQNEEKWLVVAKISDEKPRRDISISGFSEKTKRRSKISTSSAESVMFSSETSRSISTDSLETRTIREPTKEEDNGAKRSDSKEGENVFVVASSPVMEALETRIVREPKKKQTLKKEDVFVGVTYSPEVDETAGRLSIFQRLMLSSDGSRSISSDSFKTRTIPNHPEAEETAARLSVFERMIPCAVEGKVRESYAVVKNSEEPYEDFRRSMMEMILEKGMSEEKDLEQMLHCFVSLNSREHHHLILQAFSQIWVALFSHNQTIKEFGFSPDA